MQKADIVRLRHMLDAAKEALEFGAGKSRGDLDGNRMLVLAIIKDIEILGEAAGKRSHRKRETDTAPSRGSILSTCATISSTPTLTSTWI